MASNCFSTAETEVTAQRSLLQRDKEIMCLAKVLFVAPTVDNTNILLLLELHWVEKQKRKPQLGWHLTIQFTSCQVCNPGIFPMPLKSLVEIRQWILHSTVLFLILLTAIQGGS